MENQYILLWLEAPLQAWGHDSKFGRRDSLDFPTKSGVLGILCCARGVGGAESDWLGKWTDLDMQVVAYSFKDRKGKSVSRQPLLRDFHMVGAGYSRKDQWENLMSLKTADGKRGNKSETKITHRYYVQDMAYAVLLETPNEYLDDVIQALKNPVWDLYLGRKCCVPTEFLFQGVFETTDAALEGAAKLAEEKNRATQFQVLQGEHEGEVVTLNDVPLQFGTDKKYRDRRVTVQN